MKTKQSAALPAVVIVVAALVSGRCLAAVPTTPVGDLTAYPTVVQTGTKPTLTWNILYPSSVSDVATISPPGMLTLTQSGIYVSVQPIGTGITAGNSASMALNTDARMSLNGAPYKQLFYGVQSNVESAYSLFTKKLDAGTTINFAGRYVDNAAWTPMYTTLSTNLQVITLVNGDTPPTNFPLYQSSTLATYLKPYLSSTGKINIGPMSAIVLMELGQTNHNSTNFDYQDMVLLVNFSTKHPNNGHGNNLDGVDSSNPGQGRGGPNGAVDPSGGVDDERK